MLLAFIIRKDKVAFLSLILHYSYL